MTHQRRLEPINKTREPSLIQDVRWKTKNQSVKLLHFSDAGELHFISERSI
jgi:hypothetical protein